MTRHLSAAQKKAMQQGRRAAARQRERERKERAERVFGKRPRSRERPWWNGFNSIDDYIRSVIDRVMR